MRSSPTVFAEEDGVAIRVALEEAAREPVRIPIDPKVIAMTNRKKTTHPKRQNNKPDSPSSVLKEDDASHASSYPDGATDELSVNPDSLDQGASDQPEGIDEGDDDVQTNEGVSIEKADRSLAELHRWYRSGRLIIDPEWQRSYVWDNKRASKLVESFLMEIPIPVVYLSKTDDGKYEVIDGVQRLTSVFNFFEGRLTLSGMEFRRDLNKKTFKEIELVLQNKLEDATVRTFELSPKTSKNLLFIIFERLKHGWNRTQ